MSLAEPNDEYNELVPEGKNFVNSFFNKSGPYLIILVIGILLGAFIQYQFLSPLFQKEQLSSCADCLTSKQLLNKENACLYSLVDSPQTASTKCRQMNNLNQPNSTASQIPRPLTQSPNDIQKDFNEEAS